MYCCGIENVKKSASPSMRRVAPHRVQKDRSCFKTPTRLWNQSKYGCLLHCSEAASSCVLYDDVVVPAEYSNRSR